MVCVPGGHLIGLDEQANAHAIPWSLKPTKGDFVAECGAEVKMYGVQGVSPTDGSETGVWTYAWPPRAGLWKKLNGGSRCAACHIKTGRKKPDARFDGVFNIEPAHSTYSQAGVQVEEEKKGVPTT